MTKNKSQNQEVADNLATYFRTTVKEEVKIQNKEHGTNIKVLFKTQHVNITSNDEAVKFVVLFVYGE